MRFVQRKRLFFELVIIAPVILLSSCVFNSMYYKPSKIPADKRRVTMVDRVTHDSIIVLLDEKHQPTFTQSDCSIKAMGYNVESYLFKSKSGNQLWSWMILPETTEPKATLFFLHGNAGNIFSQYGTMIPLVKKGFRVFIFDYSGYGFSEGEATRDNVLEDANSALDFLKTSPGIQKNKLIVYGQSMGGHLSAVIAAENEEKVDALVIEGAFSSHKDVAASRAGFIGRWIVREKYSGKESLKEFKKPVLIIHSTEDQVIPFEQGQALFESANQPKEFFEIKGRHIAAPALYTDSIDAKLSRWLK